MSEPNKEPLRERVLLWFILAYCFPMSFAVPYFNWEYAQKNGFGTWIMLGQLVPTAQALVWPYYVWEHYSTPPSKEVLEVEEFNSAYHLLKYAHDMENKLIKQDVYERSDFIANCRDAERDILPYFHQAVEAGRGVDATVINNIYPELGTKFKTLWVEGWQTWINSCETGSQDEAGQSLLLIEAWNIWYKAHSKEIEDALSAVSQ